MHGSKRIRRKEARALTPHVIARWYRPPEIILLENNYNQKVDMWCLGCTLAELIYSTNAYKHLDIKNRFLFQGDSCFPFTPCGP